MSKTERKTFRMVDEELICKLRHAPQALREIGAHDLANMVEAVCLSSECPMPSWPESLYVLDQMENIARDFITEIDNRKVQLSNLADKINKEGAFHGRKTPKRSWSGKACTAGRKRQSMSGSGTNAPSNPKDPDNDG